MTTDTKPKRHVMVQARYVRALAKFAGTENSRYYLHGIYTHPVPEGGVAMIATNGHIMGIILDSQGMCNGAHLNSIPKDLIAATRKKQDAKKEPEPRYVTFSGDNAIMTAGNYSTLDCSDKFPPDTGIVLDPSILYAAHAPEIDGRFPDYARVIPTHAVRNSTLLCFNPKFLATFGEAVDILRNRGDLNSLTLIGTGNNEPAIVVSDVAPELTGIIMPMRGFPAQWVQDRTSAIPQWIRSLAK